MNKAFDQKLVLNTEKLLKQVLVNMSKVYLSQYDSKIQVSALDHALFDRDVESVDKAEGYQDVWLEEYFGRADEKVAEEIPFAGTAQKANQIFFLDFAKKKIREITYDFQRIEILLPSRVESKNDKGEKIEEYKFSEEQSKLIFFGLIRPTLAIFEQREIAAIQSRKQGTEQKAVTTETNPFSGLGNQFLVRGISGEFDQLLSFDDIQELISQIKTLQAQGKSPQEINELVKKNLEALGIKLTADNKIELFAAQRLGSKEELRTEFSLEELVKLADLRLGLEYQTQVLSLGRGKLSLPAAIQTSVQVSAIETALYEGGDIYLDQAGTSGSNAFFFVTDQEGSIAVVSFPIADFRSSGHGPLNFRIAPLSTTIPQTASPVRIDTLQTESVIPDKTLRQILAFVSATASYTPAEATIIKVKLPETISPKPEAAQATGINIDLEAIHLRPSLSITRKSVQSETEPVPASQQVTQTQTETTTSRESATTQAQSTAVSIPRPVASVPSQARVDQPTAAAQLQEEAEVETPAPSPSRFLRRALIGAAAGTAASVPGFLILFT